MRHNDSVLGQAPQTPDASTTGEVIATLQHLGWVDITALAVLGVFFLLGLFKGFLWQVSRVAILVIAYGLSGRFGQALSEVLLGWTVHAPSVPSVEQQETAFYVGCVLIFLATLIVLSLIALLLQKLIAKAGMSFFDRLGGGVVGVATGSAVVLFLLTVLLMFFPDSGPAQAAESSQSLKLSRWAMQRLGSIVPPELDKVFGVTPRENAAPDQPGMQPMFGTPTEASGQKVEPHTPPVQPPAQTPPGGGEK